MLRQWTGSSIQHDVRVGNLGSGSDYTAFLQHLGVPSADIGSRGPYGVYHSAFQLKPKDNRVGQLLERSQLAGPGIPAGPR